LREGGCKPLEGDELRGDADGLLKDAERLVEALIFASSDRVGEEEIARHLPEGVEVAGVMARLERFYSDRGVDLVRHPDGWQFSCARMIEAAGPMEREVPKRFSRAALEVLAVIAWQQPITLAQLDEWRGKRTGPSVMRTLEAAGLIAVGAHLQEPGNPAAWITTERLLQVLELDSLEDLPEPEDLLELGAASADHGEASDASTPASGVAPDDADAGSLDGAATGRRGRPVRSGSGAEPGGSRTR
jgi:segregation and condensation protein B